MTKSAAKQMLEEIYAKQFLKRAEGVLDAAAANFKQRTNMANGAMAKLTAPKTPAPPAMPPTPATPSRPTASAPQSSTRAFFSQRWPFDKQGPGDAQGRAAIYDTVAAAGDKIHGTMSAAGDYVGSRLPVGKPGNSGYGAPKSTWRPPGTTPDMSVTSGNGAVAAPRPAAPAAPPSWSIPPQAFGAGGAGPGGSSGTSAASPKPVANPLTQAVPGRNIELMPDGSPDTSSLINPPQTQTTPTAAPANNSPQALGSAPGGPGGAPTGSPADSDLVRNHPPGMYSQLPDGSYVRRADIPNTAGENGYKVVPANYGVKQETTAPAQQQTPASGTQQPAQTAAQTAGANNNQTPPQQTNFQKLHDSTTAILNDKQAPPEKQQQAMQDLMQAHADANPKVAQGLKDKLAGKQTPESGEFDISFEAAANDQVDKAYRQWKASNPKSSPQQDGEFMGQMWSQIQNMPTEAKWAMGLGIPMALLGLGSSMFGGGGLGSMLMSVLGIGAAGLGAANAGLLGSGAQGAVNNTLGDIGKAFAPMFGINLPNEEDIRGRLTAAAKQGPDQAQAELEKIRGEVGPYASYSPEAQKFMTESADKNYMYNQALNYADQNFDTLLDQHISNPKGRDWKSWWAKTTGMDSAAAKQPGTQAQKTYGAPGSPERKKFIEENMLPRRGWKKANDIRVMLKAARCWAGYEPVPGTKAYSAGSCRPKGSKKTQKEVVQGKKHTEKKAAKPQLQYSDSPLTMEQALKAQKEFMAMGDKFPLYKHMAGAKTPMDVRNGLEKYLRQKGNKPIEAFDHRIAGILGGNYVPHSAAEGEFPQQAAPAQPATIAPQQAAKPAAPANSPAPVTPPPAQAPRPATPVASPSALPPPSPSPSAPPQRPTMTQMPPKQIVSTQTPQDTAYKVWQNSQKQPMPTINTPAGRPAPVQQPGAGPQLQPKPVTATKPGTLMTKTRS